LAQFAITATFSFYEKRDSTTTLTGIDTRNIEDPRGRRSKIRRLILAAGLPPSLGAEGENGGADLGDGSGCFRRI